jgi:predicted small lipoprotein YifL
MMRSIRIAFAVLLAATVLSIAACEQKGPAEQAGEKIDKAAETGAEAVATAGSEVKDAINQ